MLENVNLKAVAAAAWKKLGNPVIGLVGIIVFLWLFIGGKARTDLWLNTEHLVGVMLIVVVAVFVILVACYFLFDAFLSFREFGEALHKWETDRKAGKETSMADALVILSMALRSGLVFVGICLLSNGALGYLDFGG